MSDWTESLRDNIHHQINVNIFILKNVNGTLEAVMTTQPNIQKLHFHMLILSTVLHKMEYYEKHCRSHTKTINFSQ